MAPTLMRVMANVQRTNLAMTGMQLLYEPEGSVPMRCSSSPVEENPS